MTPKVFEVIFDSKNRLVTMPSLRPIELTELESLVLGFLTVHTVNIKGLAMTLHSNGEDKAVANTKRVLNNLRSKLGPTSIVSLAKGAYRLNTTIRRI